MLETALWYIQNNPIMIPVVIIVIIAIIKKVVWFFFKFVLISVIMYFFFPETFNKMISQILWFFQ